MGKKHGGNIYFCEQVATQRVIMCILRREVKNNKVCFMKANANK
jgi:hypothetical protein